MESNATQLIFTHWKRITIWHICNQMSSSMVCLLMFCHASRRYRLKYSEIIAIFSANVYDTKYIIVANMRADDGRVLLLVRAVVTGVSRCPGAQ